MKVSTDSLLLGGSAADTVSVTWLVVQQQGKYSDQCRQLTADFYLADAKA